MLIPRNTSRPLTEISAVKTSFLATMTRYAGIAQLGEPTDVLVVADPVHRY